MNSHAIVLNCTLGIQYNGMRIHYMVMSFFVMITCKVYQNTHHASRSSSNKSSCSFLIWAISLTSAARQLLVCKVKLAANWLMKKISISAVYISMVNDFRSWCAILAGALQGRFCPFREEACNSERYSNLNSAVPACITKDSVPKVTPSYVRLVTSLEQEHVRQLQLDHLKVQRHISISFDGGAIRSGESFYTVHATTMARDVMLLDGQDGTHESHTGVWIAELVLQVGHFFLSRRFLSQVWACLDYSWNWAGTNWISLVR